MIQVRLQSGKPILEDGKVGTEEACCCSSCENGMCEVSAADGQRGGCEASNDPLNPRCCCECVLNCGCIKEVLPGGVDVIYKARCYDCCPASGAGPFFFYAVDLANAGVGDPAGWVNNIADYLRNNGYSQVTTHSESCDRGAGEDTLYWVRACCFQIPFCPEEEDCKSIFDFAPNGNTTGWLADSFEGDCGPLLDQRCLRICGDNPLP